MGVHPSSSGRFEPSQVELGSLANLSVLLLSGNQLSGCIPNALQDRLNAESPGLGGLPFC